MILWFYEFVLDTHGISQTVGILVKPGLADSSVGHCGYCFVLQEVIYRLFGSDR